MFFRHYHHIPRYPFLGPNLFWRDRWKNLHSYTLIEMPWNCGCPAHMRPVYVLGVDFNFNIGEILGCIIRVDNIVSYITRHLSHRITINQSTTRPDCGITLALTRSKEFGG